MRYNNHHIRDFISHFVSRKDMVIIMKKVLSLVLTLILVFSGVVGLINTSAASSVMAFSSSTVDVGETVVVTVRINADQTMYSYSFNLIYDPEVLKAIPQGDAQAGGAGTLTVADSASSKNASISCKFKALKAGTCYIRTSDMMYVTKDLEEITVSNQGSNITVKDAKLSANADLKSLSLSDGKLSPAFSASTTSYSVTVGKEVTECSIYATAAEDDAKVSVDGGSNLQIGNNACTVTVTAPSGAQKVYKINIVRTEEATQSTDSSEEDTSSEETSSLQPGSLETQIDGATYTVAENIDGVEVPLGFSADRIIYNAAEVTVIKDEAERYTIYYLTSADVKQPEPYLLDTQTNSFKKLQYMKQGGRYYIFEENPDDDKFDGFYATNSEIAGFSVSCYSSNQSELSAFSYVYCFNGEESGYYRYDSVENVLQRYPEMKMSAISDTVVTEEKEFGEKFGSLSANRKMIVIGCLLLIVCFLTLVILLVARAVNHRRGAEYATNLNYANEFDDVEYDDKFSLENGGFVAADDEVLADLDFGEDENMGDVPDYLIDEDATEEVELDAEVETELLTEDDSYEEEEE